MAHRAKPLQGRFRRPVRWDTFRYVGLRGEGSNLVPLPPPSSLPKTGNGRGGQVPESDALALRRKFVGAR